MITRLPNFTICAWICEVQAHPWHNDEYDIVGFVYDVTAVRQHAMIRFSFRATTDAGITDSMSHALSLVVTDWALPRLGVSRNDWHSDTDVPQFDVVFINNGQLAKVEYDGISCECSPCRCIHNLLNPHRQHLEKPSYGTVSQVVASDDAE